ncbi:TadE/TadG family type IV pilus assembly protein [Sphingomonas sp.]|uniref:TadE/TadG family type IV pilus assembly protein n=1 Tax=Sphingomonas sp. TaxID=28214 RepID=UPI00307EE8E3
MDDLDMRIAIRRLATDTSGVAAIEFAYVAPIFLFVAFGGIEVADFAFTHMQLSQITASLADNAGRVAMNSDLAEQSVHERDINELLAAAKMQGDRLDLGQNGRLILSSLQVNEDGGQWIAWQRCAGALGGSSRFGDEGTGAAGTGFAGVSIDGRTLKATAGSAVMVAEIRYRYTSKFPLTPNAAKEISYAVAFPIRDHRSLAGLINTAPTVTPSSCG